jgi:hypothetical protein
MIELRRVSAPMIPMQKRINDKNMYHFISITTILHTGQLLPYSKQDLLKKYL